MEQRLQKLEAEAEIRRVMVEYANALDARDFGAYAALFTEQGEWTGGLGSQKGRAAIEQMLVDNIGRAEPGFINASNFHMLTNPHVVVDGDTAQATSMFLVWVRSKDENPLPKPVMAGRYVDEFVRTAEGWKIARRVAYDLIPYNDPLNPAAPDPGRTEPDPNSVEARLRRVEDELAIRRVLVEYSTRLQALDIEAYVALFARGGTWRNGDEVYHGPDELRPFLQRLFGGVPAVDYLNGKSYQIVHNPQIDLDGDRAKVRSRHTLFRRDENNDPRPVLAGVYEDDFIREDGEWKILFRDDHPVIPFRDEWRAKRATVKGN